MTDQEAAVEAVARAFCWNEGCLDCGSASTCRAWDAYKFPIRAAIAAHLKVLEKQGLVVVPREPTEEMILAGGETPEQDGGGYDDAIVIWEAMIAKAAPKATP